MRILYDSIIEIDDTDEEMDSAMNLVCKCGHRLRQHSWTTSFWYPDMRHHTLYPNACVRCDCLNFKVAS